MFFIYLYRELNIMKFFLLLLILLLAACATTTDTSNSSENSDNSVTVIEPATIPQNSSANKIIGTMDTFDKQDFYRALDYNSVNSPNTWNNTYSGVIYVVTPLTEESNNCRQFSVEMRVKNQTSKEQGTACRINYEWIVK